MLNFWHILWSRHRNRILGVVISIGAVLWLVTVYVALSNQGERANSGLHSSQNQDLQELIQALEAKLPPPKIAGSRFHPEHEVLDNAARVRAVQNSIAEHGVYAIPSLVEVLDNEKYSYTGWNDGLVNFSVGQSAKQVLDKMICVVPRLYNSRKDRSGRYVLPPNWHTLLRLKVGEGATTSEWWKNNSKKTLRQIQIDVLKWRIQKEKEIGFSSPDDLVRYLTPLEEKLRELE